MKLTLGLKLTESFENFTSGNLVKNGDFTDGISNWTLGLGWTVIDVGGNNVAHNDGSIGDLSQTI